MLISAGRNIWTLPRTGKMLVEGRVYLSGKLKSQLGNDSALTQLAQAAELPGVFKHVVGLPDMHSGFGLPIGGVLATDAADGVVSAGAVGMDINCGVRLMATPFSVADLKDATLTRLMESLEQRIPSGIGRSSPLAEYRAGNLASVLQRGSQAVVDDGYGLDRDVSYTEEEGCLAGADPEALPKGALKRMHQLSTLGGGNHFLEFCLVDRILHNDLAEQYGLARGTLAVMIHSGSRGLGHQVCTDYSRLMLAAASRYKLALPSKGLAAVPIASPEGRQYLAAMACAVNYAFANRQLMAHHVRTVISRTLGIEPADVKQVYDVAHNIAKFERHFGRRLLVHRKGATRALPPGHSDNPPAYLRSGHPALIPGSMGTGSYVVAGTEGLSETFFSVNHGAGRVMSRTEARKNISVADMAKSLGEVKVNASALKRVLDEAPAAYKDIDEVTAVLADLGLTRPVVRLKPLAVIKGEGDE
ncbi:MAG TPA: RtcB family protein [Bacillota bacterium]|nr:RtcB family protein [Bacillota bacterium]